MTDIVIVKDGVKECIIRTIVELDNSPGPFLYASLTSVATRMKTSRTCSTARAVQDIIRLQNDPAFLTDKSDMIGINLLDCDCVPDSRTCEHLTRIIQKTIDKRQTGQFFIPSQSRLRYLLETKVRPSDARRLDWYLSYSTRSGKPIRSLPELQRTFKESAF